MKAQTIRVMVQPNRITTQLTMLALLMITSSLLAAEPMLGDPRTQPTPENPVGWRGDGNGRYPGANPPLTWGRTSKAVTELRSQASKPKEGETGKPIPDGVIREWLVLGLADVPADKKSADDFGTNEDQFMPEEGAKIGNCAWKLATSVSGDSPMVNFMAMFNDNKLLKRSEFLREELAENKRWEKTSQEFWRPHEEARLAGYAHTWIYSPGGKPVMMNLMHYGVIRVWLNGQALVSRKGNGERIKVPLVQGWNRILFRVTAQSNCGWYHTHEVACYLSAELFGADPADYEKSTNIVWTTPIPEDKYGASSPIIVGDRIFLQTEYCDLVCIRKTDGKPLWVRSTTYADLATDDDRKTHADVFAEIAPLQAKITELMNDYCAEPNRFFEKDPRNKEKIALERKIDKLVKGIDTNRFCGPTGEYGESVPTPASDGQHIYVLFETGLVACYDLNGNRLWARYIPLEGPGHGNNASPCLVDGKMIVISNCKNFGVATALDCKTGDILWTLPKFTPDHEPFSQVSPIRVSLNAEKLVVLSWGTVVRASDGRNLAHDWFPPAHGGYYAHTIMSPAVEGQTLVSNGWIKGDKIGDCRGGILFQTLPDSAAEPFQIRNGKLIPLDHVARKTPDGEIVWDCLSNCDTPPAPAFPRWIRSGQNGSLLLYNGLAYLVSVEGLLTVMDAAKGEIVYRKPLDLGAFYNPGCETGCSSSPTLGGRYIYIFGNQGTTLVLEPGRVYKQVARNRIESVTGKGGDQENMASCPVFDGNRVYFRGLVNLYCIGETK